MKELYDKDFEIFLQSTNEKDVLFKEFESFIKENNIRSILDIGAGNGDLAIPLSKMDNLENYLAIEPSLKFSKKLKEKNINVLVGKFPNEVNVEEKFDLVLSSHSIPTDKEKMIPFIENAKRLNSKNGKLVIITYKGEEDDWTELCGLLNENRFQINQIFYKDIIEQLSKIGEVKIKKITTTVSSPNIEDVLQALSFVFGYGEVDRKKYFFKNENLIKDLLVKKYYKNNIFSFPFRHFFISV